MSEFLLDFAANGLTGFGLGAMALFLLVVTQVTIFTVTLYLHRSQTHRGVDFHPLLAHFFRFWSWLTTGMVTREWVAIHRKHHAHCETSEDPHSPHVEGINKVFWQGVELYRTASQDRPMLEKYGRGCPNDWLERHVYGAHPYFGPGLMMVINLALFGVAGLAIWGIQMLWIPFWAAGVVNGLGHWWGYRNFETTDQARNLTPWGFWIGGEELHNNHHAFPSSAKFALRKFEVDIGWIVIRGLRKAAPRQGAARGAEPGCATQRKLARLCHAEGRAHPPFQGDDGLLARRHKARPAPGSREDRRRTERHAAAHAPRTGQRWTLAGYRGSRTSVQPGSPPTTVEDGMRIPRPSRRADGTARSRGRIEGSAAMDP